MSGRDLLYKPAVPLIPQEESDPKVKKPDRSGLKGQRSRELGKSPDAPIAPPAAPPAEQAHKARGPAYKAAYFNKDISGVNELNQRQSGLKALRGAEGASDLRKIAIPGGLIETPDPAVLRGASDLMGLDGSFTLDLESLLGRQGAWTRGQGVTAELIMQRLRQLEQMVEARKQALARMKAGARRRASSVTLEQALVADGQALAQGGDVVSAGKELVGKTVTQAQAMHRRIAKALGLKAK